MIGLKRKIIKLIPHQNFWDEYFIKEKERILKVIPELRIEHIGSTSISTIKAKPIIDILVGIDKIRNFKKYKNKLKKLGYKDHSNRGSKHDKFLTKGPENCREVYMHVARYNGVRWKNDLRFRDTLRKNQIIAKQYESLKINLSRKFKNRDNYTKAKSSFIQNIIKPNKRKIYFITGVSGAGKSTMVPLLKKKLPKAQFDIHDFDEHGVPVKADAKWRQKKTKEWLQLSYKNANKGKSTIICGITIPEEILDLHDKRRKSQIAFCFLNHTNHHIKERLQKRFKSISKIKELRKVFNIAPEEFIKNNLQFATKIRKMAKNNNAHILTTTKDTPNKTADKIIKWIYKNKF